MKGKPTTLHTLEIEFYIVSLGVSWNQTRNEGMRAHGEAAGHGREQSPGAHATLSNKMLKGHGTVRSDLSQWNAVQCSSAGCVCPPIGKNRTVL